MRGGISKHQAMLETLLSGHLAAAAAGEAAKLSDGLLPLVQLRHKRQSKERFGSFLTTSIDGGGGEVHKLLKGEQQPDVMCYTLFAGIATDPSHILKEKLAEWTNVWKCDDAAARAKACTAICKAIADAVLAGDYDEASGDLWSGRQRSKAAGAFAVAPPLVVTTGLFMSMPKSIRRTLIAPAPRPPLGSASAWCPCSTS